MSVYDAEVSTSRNNILLATSGMYRKTDRKKKVEERQSDRQTETETERKGEGKLHHPVSPHPIKLWNVLAIIVCLVV